MEIELKQAKVFTANGLVDLGELRIESEWEGFLKLRCAKGFLIVLDERSHLYKCLDDAFDSKPYSYKVISASPDVAHLLNSTPNTRST